MKADKEMTAALIQNDLIKSMGQQIEALMKSLNQSEKQKNLLVQQLKFQYQTADDNDKKCTAGHLLRYVMVKTLQQQPHLLTCAHCARKVNQPHNVCWVCELCQQSYCVKCVRHRTAICPYAHPLVESKEYKVFKFCDVCGNPNIKSGWNCNCDFDICDKCYHPEK